MGLPLDPIRVLVDRAPPFAAEDPKMALWGSDSLVSVRSAHRKLIKSRSM